MARLWPVPRGGEERVDIGKFNSDRAALANPPDDAGMWQTAILDHAADGRDTDAQPLGRAGNRDRDRFDLVFTHRASLVAGLKAGRLAEAPTGQIAMLSPARRAAVRLPWRYPSVNWYRSATLRRLSREIFNVGNGWVTTRETQIKSINPEDKSCAPMTFRRGIRVTATHLLSDQRTVPW